MTLYSIILFLHIVGALGLFVALGLEWAGLLYLRRAAAIQPVRDWFSAFSRLNALGPISMGLLLLTGAHLMATTWGWVAWLGVALAAMLLFIVVGVTLTHSRMAAINRAETAESGSLSPAFQRQLRDPFLWTSLKARTAIGLGIVFLMTVKPDLVGSLVVMAGAILLGLAATWPVWRQGQTNFKEYKNEV